MASVVQLTRVDKSFGARPVLKSLSLEIAAGTFVALVGKSGCGKTTLLRLIAGLEKPDSGELTLGREVSDVRLMFQDARLLPWKSVLDNVRLGMGKEAVPLALEALRQVGLDDRGTDWPAALSGGQRQRVALARALIHRPRLLLLDEPLGALDALTRMDMHGLIERLWLRSGMTTLLVTHDVHEAVLLADRVIVMSNGTVALDVSVPLPRPRVRSSPELAVLQERVLQEVLRPGDVMA